MTYELTDKQRRNLDKLATYLESLPEGYKHFNMATYFEGDNYRNYRNTSRRISKRPACGTVACALGHGPAAGVPVPKGCLTLSAWGVPRIKWENYTNLFVPYATADDGTDLEQWLFGYSWVSFDNTPRGAAKRIRYLLANGAPPEGFTDTAAAEWVRHYQEY